MSGDLKDGFRLGPWEVLPRSGELRGPTGQSRLEPKVMEVLLALARAAGRVVERERLLQEVWGARAAVSDEPLTRCIAELRRALGDSRHTPAFVETIPKRGYRLIGAVALLGDAEPSAPVTVAPPPAMPPEPAPAVALAQQPAVPSGGGRRRTRRWQLTAAVVAVVAAVGAFVALAPFDREAATDAGGNAGTAANTIAVLPFVNVGGGPGDEPFSEGLADEILDRLSAVEGLRVVARTSSFAFKDSSEDVRAIAARLRVAHVLEGSVRRSGEQIRINARLIDAERGFEIWSDSYEAVLDEIFALQDDIANGIVASLRAKVPQLQSQATIATRPPTSNLAAYELLLRGRQYLNRRDEQALRRSVELFREALELDGGYGQAYVELAKAYALLPSYSSELQSEMFDLSLATLAAGLDEDAAVDDAMQGVVGLIAYARWDWITAELAFRRAVERSPNDPDVLVWYSQFLSSVGRSAESLRQAQRARDIDFLSPVVNHRLAVASMWVDADSDALRYAELAEELGMPATANPDSYIVLKLRGRDYGAVRPMLIGVQTMFAQPTKWVDPLLTALESPAARPEAVRAVAAAEESRDIARKYLFGAWLYLDETDRALATALELVHDPPSFNVEFLFAREAKRLRGNARFGELLREIGLNRYWDQFGWPPMCRRDGEQILCG